MSVRQGTLLWQQLKEAGCTSTFDLPGELEKKKKGNTLISSIPFVFCVDSAVIVRLILPFNQIPLQIRNFSTASSSSHFVSMSNVSGLNRTVNDDYGE